MAVFVMAVDEWVSGVNEGFIVCCDGYKRHENWSKELKQYK